MKGEPVEIKLGIEEYHVPVQDNRGHSGRVEFRVPPGFLAQVEVLLADARDLTGWKTASEFYRWTLVHGLQTMVHRCKSKRLTNAIAISTAVNRAAQAKMAEARVMGCIEDIRQAVSALQIADAADEIPSMLLKYQRDFATIDSPYWKKKIMNEFNKNFGHLLKPVNLRDDEK